MRLTQDLSRSRVETKYGVPAEDVPALIDRIPADEREEYVVWTLYFDRPDASLAREALKDPLHCTKVRLRDYGDDSPWRWFEVKRRDGRWTRKSRLRVDRDALASRRRPRGRSTGARAYLEQARRGELVPIGGVYAFRRSFLLKRDLVRITLDHDIAYHRPGEEGRRGSLLRLDPRPVLEVKHAGRLPDRCLRLLDGLEPIDFSKFRNLVRCLRVDRL